MLVPKPRRQQRRWSTDGGDISFSSEHSGGGGSSLGDWLGSDGDSGGDGGGE